jgi:hypothetical protein
LYLFTFDKLSMLIIPTPSSLSFKQHTFRSTWFGLLSHMNFQIKSLISFFPYISRIPPHFTMLHVRSLYLI